MPLGCLCDLSSVHGSRKENGMKWVLLILTFGERLWMSAVEQRHYAQCDGGEELCSSCADLSSQEPNQGESRLVLKRECCKDERLA